MTRPGDADDTIVALATAMGESALGVVRVSGPGALGVVAPLLGGAARLAALPSHTLRRVTLVDSESDEAIDEALCAVMRAPRSYTGEDVVELSCHGSPALLRLVVDRIVRAGARLAEPGEFTRRAFVNGRIDLARAEAVALLIGARTERAVRLAARALGGGLSVRVRGMHAALLDLVAGLEVTLDFPEEGVGADGTEAVKTAASLRDEAAGWLAAARQGRLVHDGLTVALVGPPNAGKSSLLNALVGQERAIVSPVAGTTRDVVEGAITIDGVPVRLLDTAGIGEARDAIEAEGIRRSRNAIAESDLLVVVLDGSRPPEAAVLGTVAGRDRLVVRAKADLSPHPQALALEEALAVSALTGEGMGRLVERLRAEISRRVNDQGDEGGIVASLRQSELLARLHGSLAGATDSLAREPLEVALVDLRQALQQTADLLGIEVGDAILDRIFSTVCLGK